MMAIQLYENKFLRARRTIVRMERNIAANCGPLAFSCYDGRRKADMLENFIVEIEEVRFHAARSMQHRIRENHAKKVTLLTSNVGLPQFFH